jgi:hypothetical protein
VKQCFCEHPIPRKPRKCANEGGDCGCPSNGRVFYGTKATATSAEASFMDMVDTPYAHKSAKNNGPTPCKNNFFEGDPLPGISKQCYCDGDNWYPRAEMDIDLAQFAAKKAEEEALQQQVLAEAARKAAEEEAVRVIAETAAATAAAEA